MKYTIEKGAEHRIPINRDTIFIKDLDDMETLEYWEERLEFLEQPYMVAFRKKKGRILYSIFTRSRGKNGNF